MKAVVQSWQTYAVRFRGRCLCLSSAGAETAILSVQCAGLVRTVPTILTNGSATCVCHSWGDLRMLPRHRERSDEQ